MTHSERYAWRDPKLGHFTDIEATCVLDLESTCHTGGWCFGSLFDNWRVAYAPRIDIDRVLGHRWNGVSIGHFCDAWWLSAGPEKLTVYEEAIRLDEVTAKRVENELDNPSPPTQKLVDLFRGDK